MWPPSILLAILFLAASASGAQQKPIVLRVGYFPNITHAQALVGRAGGQFEKASGPASRSNGKRSTPGRPRSKRCLPTRSISRMSARIPTVTGYVRSQGEAVRVIAGAASGGASLVVRQGAGIQKASDFHGKKVATPQQGNSQDVALRAWMRANGLKTAGKGRRRSGPSDHERGPVHALSEGTARRGLGSRALGGAAGSRSGRPDFSR